MSLATGDEPRFAAGLARLEASLHGVGFDGRFLNWPPGSFPSGCPAHLEVPFAFKPYCFDEVRGSGGRLVLWLDSSCVVVRPLDRIFDRLERTGYLLSRNRDRRVGQWSSDLTLRRFGVSRDETMQFPEVNAAAVGLDLGSPAGAAFLERWLAEAKEGRAFRGVEERLETWDDYEDVKWNRDGRVSSDPRVQGHRHDQTVAGLLAQHLGLTTTKRGLRAAQSLPRVRSPSIWIFNVRRGYSRHRPG